MLAPPLPTPSEWGGAPPSEPVHTQLGEQHHMVAGRGAHSGSPHPLLLLVVLFLCRGRGATWRRWLGHRSMGTGNRWVGGMAPPIIQTLRGAPAREMLRRGRGATVTFPPHRVVARKLVPAPLDPTSIQVGDIGRPHDDRHRERTAARVPGGSTPGNNEASSGPRQRWIWEGSSDSPPVSTDRRGCLQDGAQ